jgi:hypothetical protein
MMVAARRIIDIDESVSLDDVLEEVEHGRVPVELRRAGKVVAIVRPPDNVLDRDATPLSMLAFAGILRDAIPDDFQEINAELRSTPGREFDWE